MSMYTPRARVSARPSTGRSSASNSPNLMDKAATSMHRKASLNALMGQAPATPASRLGSTSEEFAIGDTVDVPGDMFGVIKFIGNVQGKQGRFLGVELDADFAARGKNNGDVDGVSYFNTSIPGSGIFLPVHRAQRRFSPSAGNSDGNSSPNTPIANNYRKQHLSPGTPSVPKFSQTVGPGARPPSPQFKRPRQSLPRPESPLRRVPNLQPTPGRQFSVAKAPTTPSAARGATPSTKFSASVRGGAPPTRPFSRSSSRLGSRPESAAGNRSPSRLFRPGDEVADLQSQLASKDKQLSDQAAQLLEMEAALKEIQTLLPAASSPHGSRRTSRNDDTELTDIPSMRRALREKNDKISSLVSEFDAHRADFRSTIETLEMASDETVRMYEARIEELTAEIGNLREHKSAQADVELIAGQLKDLEELVAELEDGLEDARRGEAEARGEVEFLRGEVERGRSELRREREKAASSTQADNGDATVAHERELEAKDDEIRAIKAILHSMQSASEGNSTSVEQKHNSGSVYSDTANGSADAEIRRLNAALQRLELHSANLEAQLRERKDDTQVQSRTAASSPTLATGAKPAVSTPIRPRAVEQPPRCEGCDRPGHDLLHCPMFGHATNGDVSKDVEEPKKADDQDKWCALCEQDGHLAFDCPNDQY